MSKIKICGLFRPCDIDFVNEAKPDFIGFVFAESHRKVTMEQAKNMRSRLLRGIVPVGVFVNAKPAQIAELFQTGIIEIAQLHGQEDESYISELQKLCPVPVIKAISVETIRDITKWNETSADYLLLDNGSGGTGKTFNWNLIPEMDKRFFLAGGIGENNIEDAKALSPFCIDVSSGVETDKVKDREKILEIVRRVRGH